MNIYFALRTLHARKETHLQKTIEIYQLLTPYRIVTN